MELQYWRGSGFQTQIRSENQFHERPKQHITEIGYNNRNVNISLCCTSFAFSWLYELGRCLPYNRHLWMLSCFLGLKECFSLLYLGKGACIFLSKSYILISIRRVLKNPWCQSEAEWYVRSTPSQVNHTAGSMSGSRNQIEKIMINTSLQDWKGRAMMKGRNWETLLNHSESTEKDPIQVGSWWERSEWVNVLVTGGVQF